MRGRKDTSEVEDVVAAVEAAVAFDVRARVEEGARAGRQSRHVALQIQPPCRRFHLHTPSVAVTSTEE